MLGRIFARHEVVQVTSPFLVEEIAAKVVDDLDLRDVLPVEELGDVLMVENIEVVEDLNLFDVLPVEELDDALVVENVVVEGWEVENFVDVELGVEHSMVQEY